MRYRRLGQALGAILVLLVAVSGCGEASPEDGQTTSGALPVETTARPPATAVDGETVAQAAVRLFAEQAQQALKTGQDRVLFEGSTPGEPRRLTGKDWGDSQLPVPWVLPDDRRSATSGMFGAMRPNQMSDRLFLVSIEKNGRSAGEFYLTLDTTGHWISDRVDLGPARIYDIEDATAKLVAILGPGTQVRTAVFLPSGLVFAVGNNGGREAAVYLIFVTFAPGVGGFDGLRPEDGTLLTPSDLAALP
jgi:hypothetical protein